MDKGEPLAEPLFEVLPRDGGFGIRDRRQDPPVWLEQPLIRLAYWWPSRARAEAYAVLREAVPRPGIRGSVVPKQAPDRDAETVR